MNLLIAVLLCAHLATLYYSCEAKTVVMIPPPLKDCITDYSNIAKALIDLGHNVSLCVPAYLIDADLVPYKEIHTVRYGENLGNLEDLFFERTQVVDRFWEGQEDIYQSATIIRDMVKEIKEKTLADEPFVTSFKDLHPDFFILDNNPISNIMVLLPYKYNVSFGLVGDVLDYHATRVPYFPSEEATFFEMLRNSKSFIQRNIESFYLSYLIEQNKYSDNDMVTRFAPDNPYKAVDEIILQAEIFIIEEDHILNYHKPSLPNTKLVGGTSVRDAKPLSGDLKTFVDNSFNGIIVVSFEENFFKVKRNIKTKIVDAFKNLDLNVVMKINWTLDQPGNVLPLKWIPRNDLLGHEKTKLLISHCGKNEQYEALYHSVPILCLPLGGDQFYFSFRISTKEFGLQADIRKITSDELTALIEELVNVPKYKTNIQKASMIFKELYKVPSKEAAYWFDHVMKYGGEHMRASYQKKQLNDFWLRNVQVIFLTILIFFLIVCVLFCIYVHRYIQKKEA